MKRDINNLEDIEMIIGLFYEKVKSDPTIGFFFTDVVQMNWEKHLKQMNAFWENVLFFTGNYEGNPLETHIRIDRLHGITEQHFKKWLQLFNETLDAHFQGPNAEKMKAHSKSIADVMMRKI